MIKVGAKEMCSVTQLFQCMLSKTSYGVPWSPELPVHGKELSCRDPIGLEGHSPQPVLHVIDTLEKVIFVYLMLHRYEL